MSFNFQEVSRILANPSWDIIVLFFFIAVGFFYGISAGRAKLISFMLSVYVGGFLFGNFSFLNGIIKNGSIAERFFSNVFVFFLLVLALNALFSKIITSGADDKKWWHALAISFSTSGLLFSYIFHIFPGKNIFTFSPLIQNLFASNGAFFWWLILPIIALFFARK